MTVRLNKSGTPVYRCRAAGHCQWPAGRVDAHVESVNVERLSRPDVTDLLPRETGVDVARDLIQIGPPGSSRAA